MLKVTDNLIYSQIAMSQGPTSNIMSCRQFSILPYDNCPNMVLHHDILLIQYCGHENNNHDPLCPCNWTADTAVNLYDIYNYLPY